MSQSLLLNRRTKGAVVVLAAFAFLLFALWSRSLDDNSWTLPTHDIQFERIDDIYVHAVPEASRNPYPVHPIHSLMLDARKQWEAKLASASSTYEEAVVEYQRRYRRSPPEGFRNWFTFAREHGVQLIDEYDPVMESIRPFFGLSADEILRRKKWLMEGEWKDSYALMRIRRGRILEPLGATWRKDITDGLTEMMEPFAKYLPDMEFAVHLHDSYRTRLDWSVRNAYCEAGDKGMLANEDELQIDGNTPWSHKERLCPPNSRFHRSVLGFDDILPTTDHVGPPFVKDHRKAMDYCNNDFMFTRHSGALTLDTYLTKLYPSFAMSGAAFTGDLLFPPPIQYNLNPKNEMAFDEKPYHKLLWRGSLDGVSVQWWTPWRSTHRFRLTSLFNSKDTSPRSIRATRKDYRGKEYQVDVLTSLKELNERFSGVRATGKAVQCEPMLCDFLNNVTHFEEKISKEEMSRYRYVFDTDGNSYSARFRTHLQSNQVVLKSTVFSEWYQPKIQAWLHYVPIRLDYQDAYNVLAFFDGYGENREGNHDDLARSIAEEGKEWASKFWRMEDMQTYLFRLLLEYARVLQPDRSPLLDHTT
ncbi:glycosyltransferase family 90 protein [Atractiella rhizophila]|nr:glycosyltransferase family 90 protein [Atractiella rhizophila]